MDYTDILIEPVISEKANALREQDKYVFLVQPSATKTQIKEAVKKLFNVKVLDCRGKPGRTSSYKKAIVRLAAGETIQAFEGV